ncbi:MAG: Crp/Fnr family transcriptional regulator [Deltaproteobacteria bacterium]|nr:Crp/Fnr family transcriptional regulator [Deltaproteobacteria bacterium]
MSQLRDSLNDPRLRQRITSEWGLEPPTLDALFAVATLRRFARGSAIIPQGTARSSLFIVVEGEVSLSVLLPNGQRILCALYHPGAIFGFPLVETERPRWSAAEAFTTATIALVPKRDFDRIAATLPSSALMRFFNKVLERQARFGMRLAHCIALDLRGRLALTLVDLANTFGVRTANSTRIELPLTHENLAEMVGASRERVSKAMAALMAQELIEYRRGSITLRNLNGLRDAATPG